MAPVTASACAPPAFDGWPRRVSPSGAHGVAVSRYRVSGTASGNGQQTTVALDVVLVAAGTWIAEDEFTAVGASPANALEARVARVQVRRAVSSPAR